VYKRKSKKLLLKNRDRLFWSLLSKIWRDWRSELILVKPEAVLRWRELIWNERHLRRVFTEYIGWYNHSRVHQGLNGIREQVGNDVADLLTSVNVATLLLYRRLIVRRFTPTAMTVAQ
jgi:hypothetical protein